MPNYIHGLCAKQSEIQSYGKKIEIRFCATAHGDHCQKNCAETKN